MRHATSQPRWCPDAFEASDSHLASCRRTAALAIAPPTAGKNYELVLNATMPTCKDADPAYAAHLVPMRQWAFAVWDKWARPGIMQTTFELATAKLNRARGSL